MGVHPTASGPALPDPAHEADCAAFISLAAAFIQARVCRWLPSQADWRHTLLSGTSADAIAPRPGGTQKSSSALIVS